MSLQEEELQEIMDKIASSRAENEEARGRMAQLKADWEAVNREYQQHKEQISSVAEEAEPIKVRPIESTAG